MEYTGRNRRLKIEWESLETRLDGSNEITCRPVRFNEEGLPTAYLVEYRIRSICGVMEAPDGSRPPVFADRFLMRLEIPEGYPSFDAAPVLRFLTRDDEGNEIPHPWHPNIRYYGDFAGRVCLNSVDTFEPLVWMVMRVASYLRYERYHALNEPPYPEDQTVAAWVVREGETNDWICF